MKTRSWIGNDIVDLAEPGVAGKEHDRRFMDRVFTPAERARILASAAPTIALWKTWAAKETAYKIASKLREGVVFAHREFEVVPTWRAEGHRRGDRALGAGPLRRPRHPGALGDGARLHPLRRPAGPQRRRPAGGRGRAAAAAAGAVRIVHDGQALGGVLTTRRAGVGALDRVGARPPARAPADRAVGTAGRRGPAPVARLGLEPAGHRPEGGPVAGFDVSLSHDGRFVAAAVTGPGPDGF